MHAYLSRSVATQTSIPPSIESFHKTEIINKIVTIFYFKFEDIPISENISSGIPYLDVVIKTGSFFQITKI